MLGICFWCFPLHVNMECTTSIVLHSATPDQAMWALLRDLFSVSNRTRAVQTHGKEEPESHRSVPYVLQHCATSLPQAMEHSLHCSLGLHTPYVAV